MATEVNLRNVAFEVDDLGAVVGRQAVEGSGLVGAIGEYEKTYLVACVPGPEGIVLALAEDIGRS